MNKFLASHDLLDLNLPIDTEFVCHGVALYISGQLTRRFCIYESQADLKRL